MTSTLATYTLPLDSPVGTEPDAMTLREVLATAVNLARDIITDDASVTDLSAALPVADEVLAGNGIGLTEDDLHALAAVVALGDEYMHVNGYAEDADDPDGAFAARVLNGDGTHYVYDLAQLPYRLVVPGDPENTPLPSQHSAFARAEQLGVDRVEARRGQKVFAVWLHRPATGWPPPTRPAWVKDETFEPDPRDGGAA